MLETCQTQTLLGGHEEPNMEFHTLIQDIQECTSDKQLLKVVQDIWTNKSKYRLDEGQLYKLEQAGLRKYEEFDRERREMFRNKKFGN